MIDALENARGDRAALIAALGAWRETRDPLLAAIVEHLGARVRGAAIDKANLHAAWIERAVNAEPEDVEPLLDALGRQVDDGQGWYPIRPTPQRYARFITRMRALAVLPDDPRIARTLTELVRRAPWTAGWQGDVSAIYDPILALIARIDDPRSREMLSALRARPVHRVAEIRSYLEGALPRTLETMTRTPTLDEDARARVLAIATRLGVVGGDEQRPTASGASSEDLLAAIYADPDDDGAREVYADWLLEQKDPRGELIALQFAEHRGTASAKDKKRIGSLLRAHQAEWLGELGLITKNRVFRRGFLEEAELHSVGSATPELWERVLADERLSTVRVLEKGKANETVHRRFLSSPARRSLRRWTASTPSTVKALLRVEAPLRIETLRLGSPTRDSLKLLAAATTLPALHTLEVPIEEGRTDAVVQSIAASGICARLRCIVAISSWDTKASEVGPTLTKLETLGLPEVRVHREGVGVEVASRLVGQTREISVHVRHGYELLDILRSLPICDRLSLSCEPGKGDQLFVERGIALREALLSRTQNIEVDDVIGPLLGLGA